MKRTTLFMLSVFFIIFGSGVSAQKEDGTIPPVPDPGHVLDTLHGEHPRLMLDDAGLAKLLDQRKSDPLLDRYISDVIRKADEYLGTETLSYTARENHRLMSVSRECIYRMYTLGLAWRITGDDRYAAKAERDLLAVCNFENWTPSLVIIYPLQPKHKRYEERYGHPPYSFLDVSETCHAVGIGYDWFYHYLSDESRRIIRENLIAKGLELGIDAYTGRSSETGQKDAWTSYEHNWNLVCNGGLVIGALAVADSNPDVAEIIIPGAVESSPSPSGPTALTAPGPKAHPTGVTPRVTRSTVSRLSIPRSAPTSGSPTSTAFPARATTRSERRDRRACI